MVGGGILSTFLASGLDVDILLGRPRMLDGTKKMFFFFFGVFFCGFVFLAENLFLWVFVYSDSDSSSDASSSSSTMASMSVGTASSGFTPAFSIPRHSSRSGMQLKVTSSTFVAKM